MVRDNLTVIAVRMFAINDVNKGNVPQSTAQQGGDAA